MAPAPSPAALSRAVDASVVENVVCGRAGVVFAACAGLPAVLDGIRGLAAEEPLSWRVPPLLERLVSEGRTLASLT